MSANINQRRYDKATRHIRQSAFISCSQRLACCKQLNNINGSFIDFRRWIVSRRVPRLIVQLFARTTFVATSTNSTADDSFRASPESKYDKRLCIDLWNLSWNLRCFTMRTKFLRKYVLTYFMNISIVRFYTNRFKKNSVDKT